LSCFLVWLSLSNCDAFKHVLLCSCLAFAFKLWCSQTCTVLLLSCFLVLLSLSNCDALKHVLLCSCLAFLSCFRFQIVMLSNMYCYVLVLLSCLAFVFKLWCSQTCTVCSCLAFAFKLWCSQTCTVPLLSCFLVLLSCLACAFKLWCSQTNILRACVYYMPTPAGAKVIVTLVFTHAW
jgi:hypothetical protein